MEQIATDGQNWYKKPMVHEGNGRNGFFRYLTYSEEDEKWQLVCTDAGHNEVAPHTRYPPNKDGHPLPFKTVAVGRTLTEYQMVYITKGRGVFESNQKTHVVVPGTVMMILPGMRHYYKPDFDVGWTEYWVGFRGRHADTLREQGFLSARKPVYEVGLQNSLLAIYGRIFELVQTQQPLYQIRASSLVLTLIAEVLADERKTVQHSSSEGLVEKAKFFMEENIYREVNLNGMGETLGVSTSHLNAVFKSYTAMTPYQYFISIKIRKAKELLEAGTLPIKEVAFRLGFDDQYYFSRLFRKKTGIAPSRWSSFVTQ
ncbi:MAG: AraC family transcriptional regulator [Spirochaetia bacterium]